MHYKKIFVIIMAVLMITSFAFADQEGNDYEDEAIELQKLGLFGGTDAGFELTRAPKRVEAAVMLVRLLGKEKEVLATAYEHPFLDVPEWADPYIGYMYENALTSGISPTAFGSDQLTTSKQYMTFVLRALGYSTADKDFTWETVLDKAVDIGLTAKDTDHSVFLRGQMVGMSFKALDLSMKNGQATLMDTLGVKEENPVLTKVTFSNRKVDANSKLTYHNILIDYDTLPESMKHLKYVAVSGQQLINDFQVNVIIKSQRYLEHMYAYNPNEGKDSGAYDHTVILLVDDQSKVIGYTSLEGILQEGVVETEFKTLPESPTLEKYTGTITVDPEQASITFSDAVDAFVLVAVESLDFDMMESILEWASILDLNGNKITASGHEASYKEKNYGNENAYVIVIYEGDQPVSYDYITIAPQVTPTATKPIDITVDKGLILDRHHVFTDSYTLYLDREKLPVSVKDFTNATIVSQVESMTPYTNGGKYAYASLYEASGIGKTLSFDGDQKNVLVLTDSEMNILGYHDIRPSDADSHKALFYTLSIELEGDYVYDFSKSDFNLIKKVKGLATENFSFRFSSDRYTDGVLTYYEISHLLVENEYVTYELSSPHADLKIISRKLEKTF